MANPQRRYCAAYQAIFGPPTPAENRKPSGSTNKRETVIHTQPFGDPLCLPGTDLGPAQILAGAQRLVGTPGQIYVEHRGVPVSVADAAGVRFDPDFAGRPAVIAPLRDLDDRLTSVHGRYLNTVRGQNKMLTIGPGDGVIGVLSGGRTEPIILVEGLFDTLSLACCGWPALAPIGRWATWLPDLCRGREIWLAFDASQGAEADVVRYQARLSGARLRGVRPPERCKDWNTALRKRGVGALQYWLNHHLTAVG